MARGRGNRPGRRQGKVREVHRGRAWEVVRPRRAAPAAVETIEAGGVKDPEVFHWPARPAGWTALGIGLTGTLVAFSSDWKVSLGALLMMIGDKLGDAAKNPPNR